MTIEPPSTAEQPPVRIDPDTRKPLRDSDQDPGWAEAVRLLAVASFFGVLCLSVYLIAVWKDSWTKLPLPTDEKFEGISPAIKACYASESRISAVIIAVSLGMAIGVMYYFGNFLYRKFRESSVHHRVTFWDAIGEKVKSASSSEVAEIISRFSEYEQISLDRRNAYWGLFLRAALAVIVVAFIALLISVCKIESQAGLPIITGIIAFVIGQGVEAGHGGGSVLVVSGKETQAPPVAGNQSVEAGKGPQS